MAKPTAHTTLTLAAATATAGAVAHLGYNLAGGTASPLNIALTLLAVLGLAIALAADVRRGLRIIRRHLSRRPGPRFRCTHGDPAGWDDDEYEAYFAITADKTTRPNIQPAA